ncbi:M23 family metallopeptidase [Staphylospora marina]|uniref:M23 family metallopeptidase n=1 Tax=Staphylospora marina TaxID=2490858 RepID=UPI0024061B89|nr:M23 family metallopeptidase [Staphylospora marina]
MRRTAWILLLLGLAGAATWWVYEKQKHEVIELRVPGELAPLYVKVAREQGIPWEALAAMDEVEHRYRKTDQASIERQARRLKEALDGEKPNEDNIADAWEKMYSKAKAERMKHIMEAYMWQAASMADGSGFPFRAEDRKHVSYEDTWGASRTYGGKRQHEGTDIMAPKGTPVVSVSDGEVVRKGWNRLGGWRLMIRDEHHPQMHYYYAHLSKYADGVEEGEKVKRGQVIGYVGDTGYGPEGTTGKFPPHLHFGLYVSEGLLPYPWKPVNPYALLRVWEDQAEARARE